MIPSISHDRKSEEAISKALWFQSLTLEERADLFCDYIDLILEVNPGILEAKNAEPVAGRILVLRKV